MSRLFINYRTVDEPYCAFLLDQALSGRFGKEAVFFASKSIPVGADWERHMFEAIDLSSALLVVMGKNWSTMTDDLGRQLLADPDDFVRREILTAFELGKTVVPVRFDRQRLSPHELPPDLVRLASCQDVEVRFRRANTDLDEIADRLAEVIPDLPKPSPQPASVAKFTVMGNPTNLWQSERIDIAGDFHAGPRYGWGGGRA